MTTSRVLCDFAADPPALVEGVGYRCFSDRVMGGVSDATLTRASLDGRRCVRLTGHVTRDRGGGFIQLAIDLGGESGFDASASAGVEIDVLGNDLDYNLHLRTPDCTWYGHAYRLTFHAAAHWRTLRFPWSAFEPHGVTVPLDTARLRRIGLLGWMRDFDADLALARLALY
jgi:hypothetical protein